MHDTRRSWVSGSGSAARAIGTAIVRGEFAEGERLPLEAELAKRFSVSRNTLREAMRLLVAKGMVEIAPRRGSFVLSRDRWNTLDVDVLEWSRDGSRADPAFMTEILRVREMVEPFAAAEAARCASAAQVAAIAAAVARMQREADGCDIAASVEADLAFHMTVADAARNRFIKSIARSIMHALRINFETLIAVPDNFRSNVANHQTVAERIDARDPDGARVAMERLLARAKADTERLTRANGPARAAASPGHRASSQEETQ